MLKNYENVCELHKDFFKPISAINFINLTRSGKKIKYIDFQILLAQVAVSSKTRTLQTRFFVIIGPLSDN